MIKLSYNKALKIQASQILYYTKGMSNYGRATVINDFAMSTKPCEGDADTPIDVIKINELVPRGCSFERADRVAFRYRDHFDPVYRLEFVTGI